MLKNIIVLEIADAVSGPLAGQMLSDLGAQVIKLEPPVWKRSLEARAARRDDPVFLAANQGKKSLVVDLTSPEGKDVLADLVKKSDVVLANSPPSVLKKLGLDYRTLGRINPRVICCNISGFGLVGDDVERPAYDLVIQAVSGVMSVTGGEGGVPMQAGVIIGDERGGLMAAMGILAAILERETSGVGRQIDISMCDNLLYSYSRELIDYHLRGKAGRIRPYTSSRKRADYRAFETADGYLVVTGGRGEDKWQALCKVLGREELGTDPRFNSYDKRITDELRIALEEILEPIFRTKTTADWQSRLEAADIPCAPVNTLETAIGEAEAKGKTLDLPLPSGGTAKCMRNPLLLDVDVTVTPPPRLGEHSEAILAGVLGYSEEKIRALAGNRVVVLQE